MSNVKQIDTEWTAMFHNVVDEILAPRGFMDDHHSGKRVAKLEFLTEDRIKKVANATKRVLDHYKNSFEKDLTDAIHELTGKNEKILADLEKEKARFFLVRNNDKITHLELQHFTNGMMLKVLPKVIETISNIKPL